MHKWSMGRKLFTSTGLLVVLIAVLGAIALRSLSAVQANMDFAAGGMAEKIELGGQLGDSTQSIFLAEKSYILNTWSGNAALAAEWSEREAKAQQDLAGLAAKARPLFHSTENQQRLDRLEANLAGWRQTSAKITRLLQERKMEQSAELSVAENKPRYEQMTKDAQDMQKKVVEEMGEARDSGAATYHSAFWAVLAAIAAGLILGALAFWVIRDIIRTLKSTLAELRAGGNQVAAASSQIASGSQSLSQAASEQASSVEEISASMEEMTGMTRRNGEHAAEASSMMEEAASMVRQSNGALAEMQISMGAIKESSENVAKINRTIEEIAFQTNILALNAAVEAARAGESGKGFAVVAEEVRNLAQRASAAAKDTASLIEESIGNSNQGAHKLDQVAASIGAITESAGKVKRLVEEMNEASKQQVQGIQQVTAGVAQVSIVTQSTAATAEESAATAQELNAQSMTVHHLVEQLMELTEGSSRSELEDAVEV